MLSAHKVGFVLYSEPMELTVEEFMHGLRWWFERDAFEAKCHRAIQAAGFAKVKRHRQIPEHGLSIFRAETTMRVEAQQGQAVIRRILDAVSAEGLTSGSAMVSMRVIASRVQVTVGVEEPVELRLMEEAAASEPA